MKVIFLDVDGVLNSYSKWQQLTPICHHRSTKIDPEAVKRLVSIIKSDSDSIRVVVSSTWRIQFMTQLCSYLYANGVPKGYIIGRTTLRDDTRGNQIAEWLEDHPDVKQYAILDDDYSDMRQHGKHYVQTLWNDGLQDAHVQRAIELLR